MRCPRRSEMVLHTLVASVFSGILRTGKWGFNPEKHRPDSSDLIEFPLSFDPEAKADLVVRNARVYGRDDSGVENVAVTDNVITAIGSREKIAELMTGNTIIIDARGQSVVPGFVDSHLHLSVAMQRLGACDAEEVTTADSFNRKVMAYAKDNPDTPVLHVFGVHYFDDPIISAESCRHELDELVSDRPLLVYAHDLHTVWGNTRALEAAQLLHAMPPYPDLIEELGLEEKIVLGADRMPSGEFREPAVHCLLSGPLQARFPMPVEEQLAALKKVCDTLAGMGITGVHSMGLTQPSEDVSFLLLLLELEQRGDLALRVNTSISAVADDHMLHDVLLAYEARNILQKARKKVFTAEQAHAALLDLLKNSVTSRLDLIVKKCDSGAGCHRYLEKLKNAARHIWKTVHGAHLKQHLERDNPHRSEDMPKHVEYHTKVRCDTVKIFMDGVVEKDTAYRLDMAPTSGIPEFRQDYLDVLLPFADKLGLQVACHAIGDGSVKSMLDAIAKARSENVAVDQMRGHSIPHRVEHMEMCRQQDIPRFGELGVVTSMQPLHERPPVTLWHELVPKSEWNTAFAWQDSLDDGAVLIFGSDWPIVSCDIRTGINHSVTREPWYDSARNQAMTLSQAVHAYTAGASVSEYCQNIKGYIRPGMLADMVVLSGNVTDLVEKPNSLTVRYTICDGQVVYAA